jgi:glycosyltransferase involved in cell wall biosynthesis
LAEPLRRSLGTDDRVRITGFVNQSEIPYHMLLGDVGVVCSDFDPHPLVTTEFAMCGLPVVVSDACGVWGDHDILRPGENGFTYPCGNVDGLAAGIALLLDDETLRERMGRRSLELAGEQSAEHAATVLSTLLQRVFGRNAHAR